MQSLNIVIQAYKAHNLRYAIAETTRRQKFNDAIN